MKKHLLIFLALLLSLNSAALAQEQIPSAAERIHFYHQSTEESMLSAYPYNAIPCKSASFSVLGGNGCSIFAGLHAYQWLYGRFETVEDQTRHAQQMVWLLRGESPAVQGNGPYVAYHYAYESGAKKVIGLRAKEKELISFFDEKQGILYLRSAKPGAGHFFIAVGYTHHPIDGQETFLLHIVDSGWNSTVAHFTAYEFDTFAPAQTDNAKQSAREFWMPLQEYLEVSYGLWTGIPKQEETP